ncbi:MAG: hypothetical protein R8N24_04500 [Alphaproteobacteria bacterium]|nr:hypothetical protein [Alphaproteobacteria bacterium]
MSNQQTSSMSKWTFSAPFKFSILSFLLIMIATALKGALFDKIFSIQISTILYSGLLTVVGIIGIVYLIKKLPHKKLNRRSFVSLHIIQTLILSVCFYAFISYSQNIIFKIALLGTNSLTLFLITMTVIGILLLYLMGIFISNLYAKFCRIQHFKIPTWKIILSCPFGFTGLWSVGFLSNTNDRHDASVECKCTYYNRAIDWVMAKPTNTIAAFIFITLVSGLFFGPLSVLRTFIFALIYGIWVLQVGAKKFNTDIAGKYSTMTIIANLAIVLTFIFFATIAPKPTETVTVNITDTPITVDYNQGQE